MVAVGEDSAWVSKARLLSSDSENDPEYEVDEEVASSSNELYPGPNRDCKEDAARRLLVCRRL